MLLACVGWAPVAHAEPARLALGLIVKLKEGGVPTSVVRLSAASLPRDGTARLRQRMAAVAQRKRVSFLVQRPTAFAASLIHAGHAVSFAEAQAQAKRLREDPDVEWVIVNEIVPLQSLSVPQDPRYVSGEQTWLLPPQWPYMGRANVAGAWSLLEGRPLAPVVVAVLDTGILPHPDLAGRILPGYDFVSHTLVSNDGDGLDPDPTDPGDWMSAQDKQQHPDLFKNCREKPSDWHGLGVSGILAANSDSGQDGAGMLGQLRGPVDQRLLMPVRVSGKCGADLNSILEGLLWSAGVAYQGAPTLPSHPAKIINISFGGDDACRVSGQHDLAWLYTQTIATLRSRGVLVVAAAGNGDGKGLMGYSGPSIPASCAGVLAVTGLNQEGYKTRYANMIEQGVAVFSGEYDDSNPLITDGIVTTFNDGETVASAAFSMRPGRGTSYAAPQAVGVAAMMLAVYPELSVDQLILGIKVSAREHVRGGASCLAGQPQGNCYCTTQTCGSGVLDAGAAVQWAMDQRNNATGERDMAPVQLASVDFFTPNRQGDGTGLVVRSGSSGGGGGGLDRADLLGLACLLVVGWGRSRLTAGRP